MWRSLCGVVVNALDLTLAIIFIFGLTPLGKA